MNKLLTFLGHGLLTMPMGTCLCLVGCCQNPMGTNLPAGTAIPAGTTLNKSAQNCLYDIEADFCANKKAILADMNTAEITIQALQATPIGSLSPVEVVALQAAELVVSTGLNILESTSCPNDTDVATVQAKSVALSKARANLNAVRYQQHKKLIP